MNDPTKAKKTASAKVQPGVKKVTPPGNGADADSLDAIANDTAAFVASYLKDVAAVSTSSMAAVQAGTYKVEHAWADGIKMWSTYMNGVGKAVELGTRTAKAYAPKSTDES